MGKQLEMTHEDWLEYERTIIGITESIVRRRLDGGLSISEIARRMGASRSFIYDLLNAEHSPSLLSLHRIASAVGAKLVVQIVDRDG